MNPAGGETSPGGKPGYSCNRSLPLESTRQQTPCGDPCTVRQQSSAILYQQARKIRPAILPSREGAETQSAAVSRRSLSAPPSSALQACAPMAKAQWIVEERLADRDEPSRLCRTGRLPQRAP